METVFLISYQFPPLNVGGVFRPLKFVKYFNNFGIRPIIFTLSPESYSKVYENFNIDNSLLNEIENVDKEIIHIDSKDLLKKRKNKIRTFLEIYFSVTSVHDKWKKFFIKEAAKAISKYSPKAIIVTAPPFGIIKHAVKLSKKNNIPLIIDMRDSMSMWIAQPFGSYIHYKATVSKENNWFKQANKIIAVTQQMINDWRKVHPNIPIEKYHVIPNGLDKKIEFSPITLKPTEKKFTIGYVGSFYYDPVNRDLIFKPWYKKKMHRMLQYVPRKEDWLYRSPYFLFKTLNFLFKKYPHLKNKIQINFAGVKPKWIDNMIKKFDIKENVSFVGFLPFDKVVEFQKNCDVLLSTSVKVIDGEDYCIAGKTFDYIAMQKPILSFVCEGAQKDFLIQSGLGIICNPDDTYNSAKTIKKIIDYGITLHPNKNFIEKHYRYNLTKQLAEIIFSL